MFGGFNFLRRRAETPIDKTRSDGVESSLFSFQNIAMANPDDLAGAKGIKIYRDMYQRDPEIATSHEEIVLSALARGWDVKPSDDEDDRAVEIAEFVKQNLLYLGGKNERGIVIQTPEDFLFELFINPLRDGVGVWEQNYIQEDSKIWLDNLKAKPPEDWELTPDDFGNLKSLRFTVMTVSDHDPSKFLICPWMPHFCNHYGQSRYRRLYACYWLSEVVLRMAGQYAEKRSGGLWIGKFPKGNTKAANELIAALRKAQSGGILTLPDDVTAELANATQSASGGDFWWGFLDRLKYRIRRGMLGLETTAASGATGDKAGQESRDESVKQPLVEFIKSVMCSHINQQVIQRLVDLNWGPQEAYPEFMLNPPPRDAARAAEIIVKLVNSGASVPVSEAEEMTGIRLTPEDGEAVLSAATLKQAGDVPMPPDGIRDALFAERKPFKRTDIRKIAEAQWKAIDADYEQLMLDYVRRTIEWGITKLTANYERWKTERTGINDLNLPYQGKMKSLWIAMSRAYWKAGIDSGNQQIRDAMEYKRTFGEMPVIPDDYAAFQGDMWWKKFNDAMRNTMTSTFSAGFEAGKSMSEMQADFMEAMSKYGPSDFTDKLGRNRPDWYEFNRMYRNASSKCFNTARLEIGKRSSIVVGMIYIAVLDDRTRPTHRALDGMKWPLSDPRISLYNPPTDHNCRCMMDYVYEWEVTKWDQFPTWQPAEGFGG